MSKLHIPVVLAIAALLPSALSAADTREFVDLRVQGGLVQSSGYGGALTLMAGNLGIKDATLDVPDDTGMVLGVRTSLARMRTWDGDDSVDANIISATALVGLGYYISKFQHLELCLGYGRGKAGLVNEHGGIHDDGTAVIWSGEFGWYRTAKRGYQIGVVGGWSWTRVDITPPDDAIDAPTISTQGNGLNLALSLGYRF